jgi:dienelactone hydrolase
MMTIERRTIVYDGPGGPFEGVFAWDGAQTGPRPGILVIPNVLGQKEADNRKAEDLARLGYAAFACDVFGQGKRGQPGPDFARYMNEMNADRALLRDRLAASLATMKAQDEVDEGRTAAIGFCFGGKCVLDMARSGLDTLGGVSFHGVYDRPDYANVSPMPMKLLVCHGWDDPLGPPDAVVALGQELTEGKADWQIHAYGNAGHAFTDESRRDASISGVAYEERADRRSWSAMQDFLAEVLG